jgi:hypothetical protein
MKMVKILSILFANLILFQSFNLGHDDIMKIDDLLEHATYHQEQYGDTFLEFLSEHYAENSINHEDDHQDHDNLPFNTILKIVITPFQVSLLHSIILN